MKDIQQLIKKNSHGGRYEDIFPKTFIDAVEDRESGNTLISNNNYKARFAELGILNFTYNKYSGINSSLLIPNIVVSVSGKFVPVLDAISLLIPIESNTEYSFIFYGKFVIIRY